MQNPSFERIPRELIDEIRAQNDIVEVISERVHLERKSKNYVARCPFPEHDDQDPSFSVSPDMQMFKCFGCGEGGNVITFLMKYDGLTYWEAIKMLAERAGIQLPGQSSYARRTQATVSTLKDLNTLAVEFFHKQLFSPAGTKALNYLKSRSVTSKTIAQFKLGYAPAGWNNFLKIGAREGFSQKVMLDGGLIKQGDGSPYDVFRNRVMFPIFNEYGVPIAFGGRILDDDEKSPKYLNSPETILYNKSRTLYNVHLAKNTIQKSKQAILVEGYLDAIIPYQAGVPNIVAVAGTSFTEDQARLLKRYAEEAVIIFDADMAGLNATLRSLNHLVQQGLRVKVVQLPADADPDTFVREHGVDKFLSLVSTGIDLVDFQIRQASKDKSFRTIEAKVEASSNLCDTLSSIQDIVALNEYVKRAAQELEIDSSIFWQQLRKRGVAIRQSTSAVRRTPPRESQRERVERQLLTLLLKHPDVIMRVRLQLDYKEAFANADYSQIAKMLWQGGESEADIDVQVLIDTCTNERLRGIISGLFVQSHNSPNPEADFAKYVKYLKDSVRKEREKIIKENPKTKGEDLAGLRELMGLS